MSINDPAQTRQFGEHAIATPGKHPQPANSAIAQATGPAHGRDGARSARHDGVAQRPGTMEPRSGGSSLSPARKRWVNIRTRVSPVGATSCTAGVRPRASIIGSPCALHRPRSQMRKKILEDKNLLGSNSSKQFYRRLRARLPLPRHINEKTCMQFCVLIAPFLILQKPRPTPVLRSYRRGVHSCTTRVAVTHSPLDRRKSSRLKSGSGKNFFAKFSTRPKYFVLVCRLFYFQKLSLAQAIRSRDTGGALH